MGEMIQKLAEVQSLLNAPKSNYNNFGGFAYRSAEDILAAVKPLLHERGLVLILTDTVKDVGGWHYTEALATVTDGLETLTACGNAREQETKKGTDASQISGMASSYARKYALNGLFAIDDEKDADAREPMERKVPSSASRARKTPRESTDERRRPSGSDDAKNAVKRLLVRSCDGDKELARGLFDDMTKEPDFEDCDGFWKARLVELQAAIND